MNYIIRQNLSSAMLSHNDIGRFLLDHWRTHGGTKTTELAKVSPHYTLMSGVSIGDLAPSVLMAGEHSLTAQVLQLGSAQRINIDEAIGNAYRKFVASSYKETSECNTPISDIVSTLISTINGLEKIVYDRLLLPYRTKTGIPHIICYSFILERTLVHSKPDQRDEIFDFQPATALQSQTYSMAGFPNEFPSQPPR